MSIDSEATRELLDDIWMARHGDPRFGHEDFRPFGALITRADELGDLNMRVLARLEGAYSALWSGRATDVLTLVAWLYRAMDAHGGDLVLEEWQVEQFETTVVDLMDQLAGIPELSLDQVAALGADWARRVRGSIYYAPAVEAAIHADLANHRGDFAEAIRILDGCADYRPPAGTCGPGTRATVGALYTAAGAYQQAIDLTLPDLDGDPAERCGFYPAETYAVLIEPWSRTGNAEGVIRAAAAIDATYGPVGVYAHLASAIAALVRVDALDKALPMALRYLDAVEDCPNLLTQARLAAAIAAAFASAAASDADAVVQRRDPDGIAIAVDMAQVADELAERVQLAGRRFDIRNASSVISAELTDTLALRARSSAATVGGFRLRAVGDRSAEELLSGMVSFGPASPRRAAECKAALAERLDELSIRSRHRASHMFAWQRGRTDPDGAVIDLRAAAAMSAERYPEWSAQSELLAAMVEVHSEVMSTEDINDWPNADPSWSAASRVNYSRLLAMVLAPFNPERSLWVISSALAILDQVDRGDCPLHDDPEAHSAAGAPEADAAGARASLLRLRVDVMSDMPPYSPDAADIDAAITAARRAVELASEADQHFLYTSELVETLQLAAGIAARTDGAAALSVLNDAERVARFSQLAEVLAGRSALRLDLDDLDGARDDIERALAVWTVEGDDAAADGARFDLGHVMLVRDEDALSVIDLVEPAVSAMERRDDRTGQMHGMQVLARAQSAAGRPAAAVASYTAVLEAYAGDLHPGVEAQLRAARGIEFADQQLFPEALADLEAAAAGYTEAGAGFDAADTVRSAALTAHFAGDSDRAFALLRDADDRYSELATHTPVDYERARLDFARADIVRALDSEYAEQILADVAARSRAANWIGLLIPVLHLSATVAADSGRTAQARELITEALRHAPQHGALLDLLQELDFIGD